MRGKFPTLIVLLPLVFLNGCTFCHTTQPADTSIMVYPDKPYNVVGVVHSKSWAPMLVYCLKLWPANGAAAADRALTTARDNGADAVKNSELYVETHMAILCIVGWVEYHYSGEAIQYAKEGTL